MVLGKVAVVHEVVEAVQKLSAGCVLDDNAEAVRVAVHHVEGGKLGLHLKEQLEHVQLGQVEDSHTAGKGLVVEHNTLLAEQQHIVLVQDAPVVSKVAVHGLGGLLKVGAEDGAHLLAHILDALAVDL